jgi:multisubunit Na+/H+ antiporter MnhG subunit
MNRPYRNFALSILVIGVLLALLGPSLLHTFAVTSWDRIFPPPNPNLTNPELIAVRDSVVRELSRLPVIFGIVLVFLGALNLWRSHR